MIDNRNVSTATLSTASKATRIIGWSALAVSGLALLFGLVISGPEVNMRDSVRLLYIHVPSVLMAYVCFGITLVGSVMYLRKQSAFWDLAAASAAEVGVVFLGLVLATGALWGKPTWGTYWEWDPRLTSTAVMFIMYVGYLAIRRMDFSPEVRSRRAAVVGIISILNVIIVHYSVQWWRGLHQGQTFGLDPQIRDMQYFAWFLGTVALALVGSWLLIHRFRVAWLERQVEESQLVRALAERRREAGE